jgi:DNA invertase Pin-like site-specific DNA recombinase
MDHKDGNKSNNMLPNLHYVTRSVNMLLRNARRRVLGLPLTGPQHGEHNGQAKLTWDDAVEIRRLGAEGVIQREIAARFGVKREAVGKILRNERWTKPA